METFNFSVPQDITVGKGSLSKLPEIAKKLGGKHALIISGPHLEKMGLVKKAADYLASVDIKADTFTDIEANPSVTTVEKATAKYLESGADFIVAFGGGSPMDVAKAVGVVAKYGGSVTDYEGAHKVPGPIVPLIAIPTTAGTGSEVTAFSVITDHSRNYKLTVFSYEILPKYAILDAELITTAPASVAAACGIDAFIHAEEAYVSTAASPFSDALAEKSDGTYRKKYPQICSKQKRYRGCRSYDDRLTFCRNSILVCKAWKCACNEPSGQRIFRCASRSGKRSAASCNRRVQCTCRSWKVSDHLQ